jgi:hypothetical protein
MFDRSFYEVSQAPPVRLRETELLVFACGFWFVPQCELSAREDLQLVLHRRADGRYAYLRHHDDGGWEEFQPRDYRLQPRRVPC